MDILGNARAIIEYILRKNKTKIKLTMEDDGNTELTHEWKIPASTPNGSGQLEDEVHKFVGESKPATLTNKTISAESGVNTIRHIADVSIADGANIKGSKLLDGSVEDVKIVDLDGQKLFDGSVDTLQLADDSVTNSKIETLAQDTSGAVVDTDSAQVISNKSFAFDENTVTIPDNSVDARILQDDTIDNVKLKSGIDGSKLVDGSVDDSKISSLDGSKLNDLSVTREKIADGAIDANKLDVAFVFDGVIADNSIDDRQIKDYVPEVPGSPAVIERGRLPIRWTNSSVTEVSVKAFTYGDNINEIRLEADNGNANGGGIIDLDVGDIIWATDANGITWNGIVNSVDLSIVAYISIYLDNVINENTGDTTFSGWESLFYHPVNDILIDHEAEIQPAVPAVPASGGISGDKLWDNSVGNDKIAGYSGEGHTSVSTVSPLVSAENLTVNGITIKGDYDLSDSDSYRLTDNNEDVWDISGGDVSGSPAGSLISTLESDTAERDGRFGSSVSVSELHVVVGASGEDAQGLICAGKVYVYSTSDESLLYTLESSNAEIYGYFGNSVSVSESYIVVGAYQEEAQSLIDSGRAYVYSTADGSLLYTLESGNAEQFSQYGHSVSVSESFIVVGAYKEDGQSVVDSGRAYVYSTSDGSLLYTLESGNPESSGWFGKIVSVSESYIVVGAPRESALGVAVSGRAYVYSTSDGSLLYTLESGNGEEYGYFAHTVSVSESHVVVGAYAEDALGLETSGRAYVYSTSDGSLLYILESDNAQETGRFGTSVSVNESYIAVGAYYEDAQSLGYAGRAYVYSTSNGSLLYTLESDNPERDGYFGTSVSVSESSIVVGSLREDGQSVVDSGRVYVYSLEYKSTIENPTVTLKNNEPSTINDFSDVIDVAPSVLDLKKGYTKPVDGGKIKVDSVPYDRLDSSMQTFMNNLGYLPPTPVSDIHGRFYNISDDQYDPMDSSYLYEGTMTIGLKMDQYQNILLLSGYYPDDYLNGFVDTPLRITDGVGNVWQFQASEASLGDLVGISCDSITKNGVQTSTDYFKDFVTVAYDYSQTNVPTLPPVVVNNTTQAFSPAVLEEVDTETIRFSFGTEGADRNNFYRNFKEGGEGTGSPLEYDYRNLNYGVAFTDGLGDDWIVQIKEVGSGFRYVGDPSTPDFYTDIITHPRPIIYKNGVLVEGAELSMISYGVITTIQSGVPIVYQLLF